MGAGILQGKGNHPVYRGETAIKFVYKFTFKPFKTSCTYRPRILWKEEYIFKTILNFDINIS
jgi:hypothetical protein